MNYARNTVLLACLTLTPLARACPVCGSNRVDQPRRAIWSVYGTTGAMLVLPFGMVAGFAWWLRKNL